MRGGEVVCWAIWQKSSTHNHTMASSDDSASKNKGTGAAEEPEYEVSNTSSSTTTASYDPTIYQRPHPDDRGGGRGGKKKGGATKPRGKTKAAATDKAKGTGDGSHRCANCDKPGATKKCGRCGVEWYCDRNCRTARR